MSRPEIYIENAIPMWASTEPVTEPTPGIVHVDRPRATRIILRRPQPTSAIADLIAAQPAGRRVLIEDSFGGPPAPMPDNVIVKRMPVMVRPAGPLRPATRPGVKVVRVAQPEELATAEKVIVDGFPVEAAHNPGELLPGKVLTLPAWNVWLAYRDGAPAAAGYTYDDGVAAGVYLLATLPGHRSAGLGRAIMTAAISAHPDRLAALVATDAGAPLYRSLGFAEVATSTWYIRGTS